MTDNINWMTDNVEVARHLRVVPISKMLLAPSHHDELFTIGNPLPEDAQIYYIRSHPPGQSVYEVVMESASFDEVEPHIEPPWHDLEISFGGATPLPLLRSVKRIVENMG
ncbi:hypothetical protein CCAX7_14850 [Capsulimonas corticalis]|uniref:Uncharacterized protein n=1 Tax=Capsulimonas corticalis TaxID=2219043 RepID=A0A402CZD4_9BACT|nr:hypothetical protein [Capsulimonas corticalis]BDI29434.1 hypothetical protein CCAX7_14850 [Capsulimonas corticalis]